MFESLTITRALPMPYGWFLSWADGRETRIEVVRIDTTATVKTIRWAA
jgi:hypothetical protein